MLVIPSCCTLRQTSESVLHLNVPLLHFKSNVTVYRARNTHTYVYTYIYIFIITHEISGAERLYKALKFFNNDRFVAGLVSWGPEVCECTCFYEVFLVLTL